MPVINPICTGKLFLISPGSNTLQMAIASPTKTVPMNNKLAPGRKRVPIPIVRTSKARKMVISVPSFFTIFGANGESSAKANNGTVVRLPATE